MMPRYHVEERPDMVTHPVFTGKDRAEAERTARVLSALTGETGKPVEPCNE